MIVFAVNGNANQQWTAVPAGGDRVLLRSEQSGKCLQKSDKLRSMASHRAWR